MHERIARGLCRFCGEPWERTHRQKCKVWGKLNAIFCAQGVDFDEEGEVDEKTEQDTEVMAIGQQLLQEEGVQISLNVLHGIVGGHTLIKKQHVPFLMDTGSTHNFVSEKWVKLLGLRTQFMKEFPVLVASEKQVVIKSRCTALQWSFQQHVFHHDFLVLPGSAYGVILGMQWFKMLGEIRWNCAKLTMQFEHEGTMVLLQGEDSLKGFQQTSRS
jgi:hypothetical protein